MIDIKLKKQGVYLGRAGETGRKRVWVDITAWEDEYGPGEGLMLYRNPEGKVIPMETVREEGTDTEGQAWVRLYGTVGETETAVAGVGNIEARLLCAGVVAKSDSFGTVVASSMDTGKNEDEKTPKWVRQLMTDLKAARIYVDKVNEIGQDIDRYRDAAEEQMLTSEAWAVGTRDGEPVGETDPTYGNSAKKYASDSEAWAVGKRGGVNVDTDDEAYENNAKKYMMDAGGSATAALSLAKDAEAWANGTQNGQEIASTHPAYQKNSKYWSEHAFSATPQGYEELVNSVYGHLVSDEVKIALLACLRNVAWTTPEGQTYYDALESMLNPPANLAYITAAYTQRMTVETIDELSVLRADLVVTAHYGDESTAQVYGYLLSGTLTEGTSTVTVTYGGKTATFAVTVSAAYLTPGRTYILNAPASWQMAKGMNYLSENNGKTYNDMVVNSSTGIRALTYLFPVAPGGITIKWNSNDYQIFPSFWDTNQRWKYMAFGSNVYLQASPSSYSEADIATYGVKYFAIGLGRKDNAALTDADITAANIQLEVL